MSTSPSSFRVVGTEHWRDFVRTNLLALDCDVESQSGFEGSAVVVVLGDGTKAADLRVGASRVQRRRFHAKNDDSLYYKVFWQISGRSEICQGRHRDTLNPGSWCVYDTSREYSAEFSDRARLVMLLLPQSRCANWSTPIRELAGSAIRAAGPASIALSTLSGLLLDETPLDLETQQVVRSFTLALVQQALWAELERRGLSASTADSASLDRVEEYVVRHLNDATLTPESIADAFGISRRTLYNLFNRLAETPHTLIQHSRLNRAAALLRDPIWSETSLSHIARLCGFLDATCFSRAFHTHFGHSPSVWRKKALE